LDVAHLFTVTSLTVIAHGVVGGVDHLIGLFVTHILGALDAVIYGWGFTGHASFVYVAALFAIAILAVIAHSIVGRVSHRIQIFIAGIDSTLDAVIGLGGLTGLAAFDRVAALLSITEKPVITI